MNQPPKNASNALEKQSFELSAYILKKINAFAEEEGITPQEALIFVIEDWFELGELEALKAISPILPQSSLKERINGMGGELGKSVSKQNESPKEPDKRE